MLVKLNRSFGCVSVSTIAWHAVHAFPVLAWRLAVAVQVIQSAHLYAVGSTLVHALYETTIQMYSVD